MKAEELVFVLDIGTRSVIGLVGKAHDDMLEVLCVESAEHSSRAVVDGQIEDIEQTAKIAGKVKAKLEDTLGVKLHEVHVAAAGRVLRTERVSCTIEVDGGHPIGEKEMLALETAALQKAYENLSENLPDGAATNFCSVGHSVVGYQLDGYAFSTLLGHRGRQACVELIATFLPNEVVESLYTTMSMMDLSIASMTLEPIAAMNAVVPKELHLLNIALVDVGAGTSDIAVTDKGSVCGYTMVTVAGDEITECVMQELLVDFSVAEQVKFAIGAGKDTIEYKDVLGIPYTVERKELLERLMPAIEDLARRIAEGILSINNEPPKAVFMVGGGSRTPDLCKFVARALSVDEKRVAIGSSNYMKRQIQAEDKYLSAEYATPVGIAVTAMQSGSGEGLTVQVNGTRLHLLGASMTVMEALRRGGYQYGQIMGHSGKNVIFEYNGERRIVRGSPYTLAQIQVNGSVAGLSTLLQAGDNILFAPASDGEDAAPRLRDLPDRWEPFEVELFGTAVSAGTVGWINGALAEPDQMIQQMDNVTVKQIDTVGDLLEIMGFAKQAPELMVNGNPCIGLEQNLFPGDTIALKNQTTSQPVPSVVEPAKPAPLKGEMRVLFNGKDMVLAPRGDGEFYQFFHLLNYVNIDPNDPHGEIVLLRNGSPASYLERIQDGDQIEIRWSEEDLSERIPRLPEEL